MSFSTEIKNELCEIEANRQSQKTILYGFLYALRQAEAESFYTDSERTAEFLSSLIGKTAEVTVQRRKGIMGRLITFDCGVLNSEYGYRSSKIDHRFVDGSDAKTGLFLRGVFIACGVVADPNKEYHLELSVPDSEKCGFLNALINEHGMSVKKSVRKGVPFLYTKDSERISDFLTYIGAMLNSMEIMNVKIYKDVRNNVNRAVNCEAANIDKTVAASQKQLADIEYIIGRKGINFLPDDLRQIAEIRRGNIDMSLREIGELTDPEISRSGVNHRLRRISEIAEKLRSLE